MQFLVASKSEGGDLSFIRERESEGAGPVHTSKSIARESDLVPVRLARHEITTSTDPGASGAPSACAARTARTFERLSNFGIVTNYDCDLQFSHTIFFDNYDAL